MKILWIVNTTFPEALNLLSGSKEPLKSSGGWLLGGAKALCDSKDITLFVASVTNKVKQLTVLKGSQITYFLVPLRYSTITYDKVQEKYWKEIKETVNPDVTHIHGTEFAHSLCYVNACGPDKVVVSIQGLKSAYYYYYYYGLSITDIFRNLTLRDIIRGSILKGQKNFKKSGELEIEVISKVDNIIGRTSWDKDRVWEINPNAEYHFCNETLRSDFYDGSTWSYEKCVKHSIFLSQATYPIKGIHQVLKAMPLILRHFPDTTVRVAGGDITKHIGIKGLMHYTGYGRFINNMLKKYRLTDKVIFTGNLSAEEMKQEYLKCNVFILPSTIENSPNSLGEAQILGTPCVASYVGGTMDMMRGNESNLYRFEETAMLAHKVCDVFASQDKQVDMRKIAFERHNPETNTHALISIYSKIVSSANN